MTSDRLAQDAVAQVARASYGRLVAWLAARSGDIATAEDALADALRTALETWPRGGVPEKPEAWLMTAAKRRMIDHARRHRVRREAATTLMMLAEERDHAPAAFPDDRHHPMPTVRDGRQGMAFIDAVLRSHRGGCAWVALS